ncbi:MAG: hypothetical protein MUC99_08900 [Anaerolineae bacterium]|nr:hypothetical protein [Anaerolineae bacterium]
MRRILFSLMMLALLVAPTAGQGAPDAINDALAALSQRLGFTVTLNDVFWTWEQTVFNDNELGCAPAGVTAAPASVVGYIFSFTWDEVVYTYHTAADRTKTVFCGSSADAGTTVELVDAIDVEEAIDLSNRLCPPAPANDKPYIRSRVAVCWRWCPGWLASRSPTPACPVATLRAMCGGRCHITARSGSWPRGWRGRTSSSRCRPPTGCPKPVASSRRSA